MAEIEVNGLKFHYQITGEGQTWLIYLHGLVMDNLSSGYFTIAQSLKAYRLFLYDLRGHGLSSRPQTAYRIEDHVADLYALIQAVILPKTHASENSTASMKVTLIGISFGGLIAMAFAQKYPEYCQSLILIEAHLFNQSFKNKMIATLQLEGQARAAMIAQNFEHWIGRHQPRRRQKMAERASELVYETTLVEDLEKSEMINAQAFERLDCQILALYGTKSDAIESAHLLKSHAKNLNLVWFDDCSHAILWEKTKEVTDAILNFLPHHEHH